MPAEDGGTARNGKLRPFVLGSQLSVDLQAGRKRNQIGNLRYSCPEVHHRLFVDLAPHLLIGFAHVRVEDDVRKCLIASLSVELREPGQADLQPVCGQPAQTEPENLRAREVPILFQLGQEAVNFPFAEYREEPKEDETADRCRA